MYGLGKKKIFEFKLEIRYNVMRKSKEGNLHGGKTRIGSEEDVKQA